jgi:hypothetical protein
MSGVNPCFEVGALRQGEFESYAEFVFDLGATFPGEMRADGAVHLRASG